MSASSAPAAARKQLPIRIGDVTKDNFNQLRKLNQVVFPVSYSETFYANIQKPEVTPITKLAWHNDVVVGGICCRMESVAAPAAATAADVEAANNKAADAAPSQPAAQKRIYIMTLGVLAPYRSRGIGSKLLRQILEYAESHSDIAEVFLHVQTSNDAALAFYKHAGFEVTGTLENYYKKIEPPHCHVLSKKFVHLNMGGGSSATLD